MNNKLFIIGNGFDLSLGFKTSYSDFIYWYFNSAINEYNKTGKYSDKYFIHDIINLPDGIKVVKNFEQVRILTEKGKKGNHINLNGDLAEYIIKNLTCDNWVDVEQSYFDFLVQILNAEGYSKIDKIRSIKSINESFEFIKLKLCQYLKSQTYSIGAEMKGLSYNLERVLEDYAMEAIQSKNSTKSVLFLNFNYTDTVEHLTNSMLLNIHLSKLNYDIVNIHGSITNPNNPIIFGYGDEIHEFYKIIENYNENELLKNMKSFGYFLTHNYQKLLGFIKNGFYEVHLMGHSCGLSDRVMLNTIFEDDNCQKIRIHYHDKGNGVNNFQDLTMNISRHFNDKVKMRSRVLPIK
jgi:hypothetical protein